MKGDAAGKVLYCPFLNYQGINNPRRRAHIASEGRLREGLLQTGSSSSLSLAPLAVPE